MNKDILNQVFKVIQDIRSNNECAVWPLFDSSADEQSDVLHERITTVNKVESTHLSHAEMQAIETYILENFTTEDYAVLRQGEVTERYLTIVENIQNACIYKNVSKEGKKSSCHSSFASKFCAHFNQKAPFMDKLLKDCLFEEYHENIGHNYAKFVMLMKKLRRDNSLGEYSLREIEYAVWKVVSQDT